MKKLKDLETKYDFKKVEENKYDYWLKNSYLVISVKNHMQL